MKVVLDYYPYYIIKPLFGSYYFPNPTFILNVWMIFDINQYDLYTNSSYYILAYILDIKPLVSPF